MLQPTQDWCLIKEIEQPKGTIEIANYYGLTHKTLFGEVITPGPGIHLKKGFKRTTLKPGDKVFFDRRKRELMPLVKDDQTEQYLMVRERDIDGVLQ